MFNNRQFQIIDLLMNRNVSVNKVSKIVKKSIRTVMRDIVLINEYFDEENIGRIVSLKEKKGYELIVKDNNKLDKILKEWINDDENILYYLSTKKYVTVDELSDKLYLSNPVVSEKLNKLKAMYGNTINIATSSQGHFINESNKKKIIILSNLIEKKTLYFIKNIGIKEQHYKSLLSNIEEKKKEISSIYADVNGAQFVSVMLAIYHLFNEGDELEQENRISKVYKDNGLRCSNNIVENFEKYLQEINLEQKSITRGRVLDILLEIEELYETNIYDMELVKQLVLHIKRCIAYPYILKQNEIYNILNVKALNPFAFDLSILFCNKLYIQRGIDDINSDLIGLYFTCALERIKQSKYSILILAEQISLANINKQIIESDITNINIEIVSNNNELREKTKEENIGLIINNKSSLNTNDLKIEVIQVNQIISSKELREIKGIVDDLSIKNNIKSIFQNEYAFTYDVEVGEIWTNVVREIANKLVEKNIINREECELIIEREKQDNLLVINHIAIPHCISKRKDVCIGVFVNLSEVMILEGEEIKNLVVMCVNPDKKKNIKIFRYMYKKINEINEKQVFALESYDDFINIMK